MDRTQRNILFSRLPVYYEKMLTQEKPEGREAQGKGWGKGTEPQRLCQNLIADFVREGVE